MAEINRESQEFAEIMAQVNREMRLYGELHVQTAERLKDAEMKTKYGLDSFTDASKMGANALSKFGEAAFSSGKVLLDGKKGAAAMNSSFELLTDSVKMAAVALTLLVPGGALIKGIVAGIGLLTVSILEAGKKYTQAANTMSDQLYKGYQDLAQSGAAASDGMTGLFNDAKKLGLSMNEIGQYTELIAANSKDLALFSGTVFEGRKQFADMGKGMEQYREGLMNAGLTQEQINAGAMGYLKLQSRIGLSQNKTTTELADGAKKYLLEMDALSKVTGESRKAMEDQMEAARSEERFAAKLQELRSQGPAGIAAAKELELTNIILAKENKQLAQGFRDASTGMITTEAAQKAMLVTQGQVMVQSDRMSAGLAKAGEGATIIGQAAGNTAKSMTGLAKAGAYGDVFGDYASDLRSGMTDYSKALIAAKKEQEKQGATGGKAADAAVQAQTDLVRMQQKGNEAVERFVFAGVVPATKATTALVEKTTLAAGAMAKMFGVGVGPQAPKEAAPSLGEAKQNLDASTEKAQLANERAAAAEKDANLTRAEKDRIKKEARDSEAAVMQDVFKQREAQLREQNARRAGTAAPAGGGAAPAAGGGAAPAAGGGAAPAGGATTRSMSPAGGSPPPSAGSPGGQPGKTTPAGGGAGSLKIGPNADMSSVMPEMISRLEQFAQTSGKSVDVNSAYRSDQKQAELWVRGNILNEPGILMPAAPKDDQEITYKGKTYRVKGSGQGSLHSGGNAVDISVAGLGKSKGPMDELLANAGLFRPFIANDHPHVQMMADGGIVKASSGGTPAIIGEGGRDEAVIPLKDGAVPVSLNLKEALGGATFGGYNEYAGLNQGPLSTDIDAVKNIAAAAGAFDKASQTITDPATWKQILSSGLATNYELGTATIGTKGIEGLGEDIAMRLKEIKEQGNVSTDMALKQVTDEFKAAMAQVSQQLAGLAQNQNADSSGTVATLMQELVTATKNGVDVQQKILATSY